MGWVFDRTLYYLFSGLAPGILLIGSLYLLSAGVAALGQDRLFADAVASPLEDNSLPELALFGARALIESVLFQTLFTGVFIKFLLKAMSPILAIYLAGALFAVGSFSFDMSWFLLGLVSAGLFKATGSLIGPVVFHCAASISGLLIAGPLSNLIPFLVFLY
ncbi:MAG: CPBP family intramembrane metalloprotease [Candidatus Nitrohelix vancouverensis]|uniref:CPBP family intramembrane metalloprotease n=1 Tax=Candidatus Nitrohelix vancouverensis TaxID=2705534 RepID=A0A7T0G402_9BACT|nr:MAG: CPBP family intramembrane metalloprotease [Candidatus Nitrohelix vancouverensis]